MDRHYGRRIAVHAVGLLRQSHCAFSLAADTESEETSMDGEFEQASKEEAAVIHAGVVAASEQRAKDDRYALVRFTSRTWGVIERKAIWRENDGLKDVCVYWLVSKGKYADMVSAFDALRYVDATGGSKGYNG